VQNPIKNANLKSAMFTFRAGEFELAAGTLQIYAESRWLALCSELVYRAVATICRYMHPKAPECTEKYP
jgi:hypothetical protein